MMQHSGNFVVVTALLVVLSSRVSFKVDS